MNSETIHLIATTRRSTREETFTLRRIALHRGQGFKIAGHGIGDVHEDWVDGIKDDWPAVHAIIEASKVTYGEDIAAFLCFMAVRLV